MGYYKRPSKDSRRNLVKQAKTKQNQSISSKIKTTSNENEEKD